MNFESSPVSRKSTNMGLVSKCDSPKMQAEVQFLDRIFVCSFLPLSYGRDEFSFPFSIAFVAAFMLPADSE